MCGEAANLFIGTYAENRWTGRHGVQPLRGHCGLIGDNVKIGGVVFGRVWDPPLQKTLKLLRFYGIFSQISRRGGFQTRPSHDNAHVKINAYTYPTRRKGRRPKGVLWSMTTSAHFPDYCAAPVTRCRGRLFWRPIPPYRKTLPIEGLRLRGTFKYSPQTFAAKTFLGDGALKISGVKIAARCSGGSGTLPYGFISDCSASQSAWFYV